LHEAEHALACIAAVTPEDTDVGRYARNYFRTQSKTPLLPFPEEFTTPDADLNNLLHLTAGIWRHDRGNHDTGVAWMDDLEKVLARLRPMREVEQSQPASNELIALQLLPLLRAAGWDLHGNLVAAVLDVADQHRMPQATEKGTLTSNDRSRGRFEAYILRDRGAAYLQRNDPSLDPEHDYADPFIQEAWEAWQGDLSEDPSPPGSLISTQSFRETLADVCLWLKSALECKQWVWDEDQRGAAMGCLAEGETLLGSLAQTSAQMTAVEFHAHDGQRLPLQEGEAVKLFAASALQWLRDRSGEPSVTVDMTDPNTLERYSITMQRACEKTPTQELSEIPTAAQTSTTEEVGDDCGASP
jgi:hypothetical protein